jgi:hypothetical protein
VFLDVTDRDPQAFAPVVGPRGAMLIPQGTHSSLEDVMNMLEGEPLGISTIPDVSVRASGNWWPFIHSSQLAVVPSGATLLMTCENDGITWKTTVEEKPGWIAKPAIYRGGTAVIELSSGEVIIAESQLFVYRNGRQVGVVEFDEPPTSLAAGGMDGHTLFVTTRRALYEIPMRVKAKSPGR